MPTERLSMRRIRQVLQLHFAAHASARVIARTVGVGRSTVQDYLARTTAAGLVWPLPPELTDEALEQLLFPAPRSKPGARRYIEPNWSALVREMKRPEVNLSVLLEEYQGGSSRRLRVQPICCGGIYVAAMAPSQGQRCGAEQSGWRRSFLTQHNGGHPLAGHPLFEVRHGPEVFLPRHYSSSEAP